jgi:DNA-binding NarL/FixJ family response regulator
MSEEKGWDISRPAPLPAPKRPDPWEVSRYYDQEIQWLEATTSEEGFREGPPMMHLAVAESWALLAVTALACRDDIIVRAVKAGHSNRAVAAATRLTHPTVAKIVRTAEV